MVRERCSNRLTSPLFDEQPLAGGIDLEKDILAIWRKAHINRTIDEIERSHESA